MMNPVVNWKTESKIKPMCECIGHKFLFYLVALKRAVGCLIGVFFTV